MQKLNYHYVLSSIGLVLMIESLFILLSAFVGEYYKEATTPSLYISSAITFVSGFLLNLARNKRNNKRISKREVYLTVTTTWLAMVLFGTLPFLISGAISNFTDAFFESMCGFTTTGSSTLLNIEVFPKSLHFWRSFTQWIGGIGILIFVMSFMPFFGNGNSFLYKAESTGISEEQFRIRSKDIVKKISITYIVITTVGFLLLVIGPMNPFDAACHALTSVSTGGISTKQASISHYDSAYTEYIIIFLMFMGGANFMLTYTTFFKFSSSIFKDEEFRWYIGLIVLFVVIIFTTQTFNGTHIENIENTFRSILFHVVSAITSTGFVTTDYLEWGQPFWFLFIGLVLFCSSEGSTSGGMKISRLIVLAKNTRVVFKRQIHPQALYMVKINGSVVSNQTVEKVMAFVFLYIAILAFSFVVLSYSGLTFEESIGAAVSAISNYGIGMGNNGPSGNFTSVSNFIKYYLSFLMLVGRLEVFTVLSLLMPGFWKK